MRKYILPLALIGFMVGTTVGAQVNGTTTEVKPYQNVPAIYYSVPTPGTIPSFKAGEVVAADKLNDLVREVSDQAKVIADQGAKIEMQEKKMSHVVKILGMLRERVGENDGEAKPGVINYIIPDEILNAKKVAELERKVAGIQKQITILHSKKADKVK